MNEVDYEDVVLRCTICEEPFNPGTKGGRCGYIGILPVNFCPTCTAGIMDFADQQQAPVTEERPNASKG